MFHKQSLRKIYTYLLTFPRGKNRNFTTITISDVRIVKLSVDQLPSDPLSTIHHVSLREIDLSFPRNVVCKHAGEHAAVIEVILLRNSSERRLKNHFWLILALRFELFVQKLHDVLQNLRPEYSKKYN